MFGALAVALLCLSACDEAPQSPQGAKKANAHQAARGDAGERALLEQTESDAGALGGAAQ
jgi:hypothetical protein